MVLTPGRRRKKAGWSTKKKRAPLTVTWEGRAKEAPTDEEWEAMKVHRGFLATKSTIQYDETDDDDDGGGDAEDGHEKDFSEIEYKVGDTALIDHSPHCNDADYPLSDCWVGVIVEIKSRPWPANKRQREDGSSDIWAKVQWYYSGNDVLNIRQQAAMESNNVDKRVTLFDPSPYGAYERLLSDHYDYVSYRTFRGHTHVYAFNETKLEQRYIPPGAFYARYSYAASQSPDIITPEPGEQTCLQSCLHPFSPDDDDTLGELRFCPRPSCRRWYHTICVPSTPMTPDDAKEMLLMVSPNEDDQHLGLRDFVNLNRWSSMGDQRNVDDESGAMDVDSTEVGCVPHAGHTQQPSPPPSPLPHPPASPAEVREEEESIDDLLCRDCTPSDRAQIFERLNIPSGHPVLELAQQPIVRRSGAAGGVVGNIWGVVTARRMIYNALWNGNGIPVDWQEHDAFIGMDEWGADGGNMDIDEQYFECPRCHSMI